MTDAVVEWFDSHCHLQEEFAASDQSVEGPHATRLSATVARAAEAGVTRMVCVGTGAASSAEAVALARRLHDPGSPASAEGIALWATVGLHPHDAVDGTEGVAALLRTEMGRPGTEPAKPAEPVEPVEPAEPVEAGKAGRGGKAGPERSSQVVVAVGECGLDYHYDHSPRDRQREAFAVQVELALRYGLALVVHTREAWEDTLGVLGETGVPGRTIFHCFTGGPVEARRCLDIGASLSFSGVVTFKNAADVRQAAALCPLDRLLVETDSPFLAPVPHRGSVNEPARVPLVGAAIAQVRGVVTAVVAGASTANARAAFDL